MNIKTNTSIVGQKIIRVISKRRIIIISILVLVLFGYALIQINAAVTKDQISDTDSDAPDITQKRINFNQEDIDKLNSLSGEEADISIPTSSSSENPFDGE